MGFCQNVKVSKCRVVRVSKCQGVNLSKCRVVWVSMSRVGSEPNVEVLRGQVGIGAHNPFFTISENHTVATVGRIGHGFRIENDGMEITRTNILFIFLRDLVEGDQEVGRVAEPGSWHYLVHEPSHAGGYTGSQGNGFGPEMDRQSDEEFPIVGAEDVVGHMRVGVVAVGLVQYFGDEPVCVGGMDTEAAPVAQSLESFPESHHTMSSLLRRAARSSPASTIIYISVTQA